LEKGGTKNQQIRTGGIGRRRPKTLPPHRKSTSQNEGPKKTGALS